MLHVIYHSADFDGKFCKAIARNVHGVGPNVIYEPWNYGDPVPNIPNNDTILMMDVSIKELMAHPGLVWIDHHATAIADYGHLKIPGLQMDGVAACRLAWQYMMVVADSASSQRPILEDFKEHRVSEPLSVRLAGEWDVFDRRDHRVELFQHGLLSIDLNWEEYQRLLTQDARTTVVCQRGETVKAALYSLNAMIVVERSFTRQWEGYSFLCLNTAKCNSQTFSAAIGPHHDGLLGFYHDGFKWTVSLYGVPSKPHIDFSIIAKKYGGGGHKQACGFRLPGNEVPEFVK